LSVYCPIHTLAILQVPNLHTLYQRHQHQSRNPTRMEGKYYPWSTDELGNAAAGPRTRIRIGLIRDFAAKCITLLRAGQSRETKANEARSRKYAQEIPACPRKNGLEGMIKGNSQRPPCLQLSPIPQIPARIPPHLPPSPLGYNHAIGPIRGSSDQASRASRAFVGFGPVAALRIPRPAVSHRQRRNGVRPSHSEKEAILALRKGG